MSYQIVWAAGNGFGFPLPTTRRSARPRLLLGRKPMTLGDLRNALDLLQRVFVGQGDQERLFKTIEALQNEIKRREKKA